MTNLEVQGLLRDCLSELERIEYLLKGLGDGAHPTPYIKKYAVIRATGSIETGFKKIIADKVAEGSHVQVRNFIKRKIRDSSVNPRLDRIESMLSEFDERWRARFDEQMALGDKPRLKGALTKLVDARNEFAHGGDPDIDIALTLTSFKDGVRVLEILDSVIHHNYADD